MAEWRDKNGRWWTRRNGKKQPRARLLMEDALGHPLAPGEVVHHINGDCSDDRLENLRVYASNAEHMADAHADHPPPPSWAGAMGGRPRTYGEDDEREAARLRAQGMSYSKIAKAMGLPYVSTVQHLLKHGGHERLMPGLHRPEEGRMADAAALRDVGLTYSEIGERLGVCASTASTWAKRHAAKGS